mmetsp:Transcript_45801/g.109054  ORF Transcript_45801/g.109054 Transcript_45801/m.109054 type:complete len:200 (+) Transcript_45801:226-825(+)
MTQGYQQTIGNKLNVLGHQIAVHSDEVARERLANELLLHLHGTADDRVNNILRQLVLQLLVNQAGKVSVQSFISRNQFIGERKARHETALLQPVDGAKGAAEENTFHSCESNHALGEAILPLDPLHCPLCLLCYRRHCFNGVENTLPLLRILDVLLDQQRVCLGVDVFHCNLEAVKGSCLWHLDLAGELPCKVLQDNAI